MKATPLTSAPPISLHGVTAAYGRIEVVHGVDLEVPAGSVFALLGPNGAGTSTLLKVISARMRPTAGTIAIGDLDLKRPTPSALARLGVCAIPEGRGVFPNLTVRDNLAMWTFQGVSMAQVETIAYERFPKLKEFSRDVVLSDPDRLGSL